MTSDGTNGGADPTPGGGPAAGDQPGSGHPAADGDDAADTVDTGGRRPDPAVALVAGCYVAAATVPATLAAAATLGLRGAGTLYVGFLALFAAVATVTTLGVRRSPGLPERVGATRVRWALPVLPGGYLLGFAAAARPGVPGVVAVLAFVALPLAGLTGLALATMTANRHADRLLAGAERGVEWRARQPPRTRRRATLAAGALAVVGGTAFLLDVAGGVEWAGVVWPVCPGAAAALVGYHGNPTTYQVTDAGLLVSRPLAKRVVPYDALAGYRLTAEGLYLDRRAAWRPPLRCDRGDLADAEAVAAALDERLQRSSTV